VKETCPDSLEVGLVGGLAGRQAGWVRVARLPRPSLLQAAGVDGAHVVACLPRSDGYAAGSGLILRQVPADSRLL